MEMQLTLQPFPIKRIYQSVLLWTGMPTTKFIRHNKLVLILEKYLLKTSII